jgi:MFS family permease
MRFVVCMHYAVMFIYVAEMYPTRVRSLGLGFVNIAGTFGTLSAPFIVLLADTTGLNRWLIPGAVGLVATLGIIWLP